MKVILFTVALGFVVSNGAWAGTQALVTAPAQSPFGDSTVLYCQAVNAGTKPVDVTFESHNATGAVVSTLGPQRSRQARSAFLRSWGSPTTAGSL